MNEDTPQVTPELARAQLADAGAASIGSRRDRRIQGTSTIGIGLVWGAYLPFLDDVENLGLLALLVAGFVLVAGVLWFWRERTTGTMRRHTERAVSIAFSASFAIVVLLSFIPEPSVGEVWRKVIAAGLIGAPMIIAGVWIMRRR